MSLWSELLWSVQSPGTSENRGRFFYEQIEFSLWFIWAFGVLCEERIFISHRDRQHQNVKRGSLHNAAVVIILFLLNRRFCLYLSAITVVQVRLRSKIYFVIVPEPHPKLLILFSRISDF